MNSDQLLRELERQLASGEITEAEVRQHLQLQSTDSTDKPAAGIGGWLQHVSIANIFYVIGAVIVLSGIVFLVAQVWNDLGSFSRIVMTLGLGWLLTMLGILLRTRDTTATTAVVFYALGGALVPGGALVLLHELNVESDWGYAVAFLLISAFYAILLFLHRHALLTGLLIGNATAFIYLLTNAMLDPILSGSQLEVLYQYLTMVIGASYILLAYVSATNWNKPLERLLYFAGSTAFLWAAFLRVPESTTWEFTYWILLVLGLGVSVRLRSRILLVVSTIFVLVYVSYITFAHFADSVGWPVALVLLGFAFIGFGYLSISLNRNFIAAARAEESGRISNV